MRAIVCILTLIIVAVVAACGGNGEEEVILEPASGPPGTVVAVSPACDDVISGTVASFVWRDSAGEGVGVTVDLPDLGTVTVPNVAAGSYTLELACVDFGSNEGQVVGEATFQVTRR